MLRLDITVTIKLFVSKISTINFQVFVACHNKTLLPTCTVPCGLDGPLPSRSCDCWNTWPQPGKREMEEVDLTYVTTSHAPLARARQLQEKMENVGEHMG